MEDLSDKRPLADWRASLLRLTAFAVPNSFDEQRNVWQELALGEAESEERKKGQFTVQGPAWGHWVIVTTGLGRIDIIYAPKPEGPEEFSEVAFRDVGSFPESLESFLPKIRPWIESKCPALSRFAFAPIVRMPVKDKAEGYRQISAYLPFTVDGTKCSDFQYQINRFRRSRAIGNLKINCLTKWSVAFVKGLLTQYKLTSADPVTVQHLGEQMACELVMDINTDADYKGEYDSQTRRDLLSEFVEIANDLATNGDAS